MLAPLLLGLAAALTAQQGIDSTTFADNQTADLFFRARVRHIVQDSLVHDYQAEVRTRLEARAGRSRFFGSTLIAHEAVADISWREPNDLIVSMRGVRTEAPLIGLLRDLGADVEDVVEAEIQDAVVLDRPWFVPRALGDSIRLMGVPDHAALHPLADDATRYYRYAIVDSATIVAQGVSVKAIQMRIEPRESGAALVAGDFWFDAATADLIRMQVVFLGDYLWEEPGGPTARDSAAARKGSHDAQRVLSLEADLEYALVDRRYWMPYRQMLALTFDMPWLVNLSVPARAVTTFSNYRVNTSAAFQFAVSPDSQRDENGRVRRQLVWRDSSGSAASSPDSERQERGYFHVGSWRDGSWQIGVPPRDTLHLFTWDHPLRFAEDAAEAKYLRDTFGELAALDEKLPSQWTHRVRAGTALEHLSDIVRFNRVQGASLGMGYFWRPGPAFVSVIATGRFGLSDHRPTGSLRLRRDGPAGRLDLLGYRDIAEVEPWTHGTSLGHSLNSIITGHEYADFYLETGGGLEYSFNRGILGHVRLGLYYERQRSVATATGSAIADWWGEGTLPPNPPVIDGDYFHGSLVRRQQLGPVTLEQGFELLAGKQATAGRAWTEVSTAVRVMGRAVRLTARAGATRGDTMPQLTMRLGGLETVRGYPYGVRWGREFWAAQLDVPLRSSGVITPVVFVDAGDTFSGDPLVSAGAGVSLLAGFLRFNVAKGLRPASDVRFDIHFRAPR